MKTLDLFCCGGGASRGLEWAGFEVTGVDISQQPNYPYTFIQADALEVDLAGYDFIWASPPCQGHSKHVTSRSSKWNTTKGKDEPQLIEPIRERLLAAGVPYCIENVKGAKDVLRSPIELCGSMFNLPIQRHRLFETNWPLLAPSHPNCRGIAKDYAAAMGWEYRDMSVTGKGRRKGTAHRWKMILGMDADVKMSQHQLRECIPPAYSEYIAKAFLAQHANVERIAA